MAMTTGEVHGRQKLGVEEFSVEEILARTAAGKLRLPHVPRQKHHLACSKTMANFTPHGASDDDTVQMAWIRVVLVDSEREQRITSRSRQKLGSGAAQSTPRVCTI
jgi:hypothetical protein